MKVLIIDDEPGFLKALSLQLQAWGYETRVAPDGLQGRKEVESYDPDIVLSDVKMPKLSGLDLLTVLKAGNQHRLVILMTAHGSIDLAVEAMKRGAFDFLAKPVDDAKLRQCLQTAREKVESGLLACQRQYSELGSQSGFGDFVGTSEAMKQFYRSLTAMAEADASVLITGESGTGKELAARTIHRLSRRSDGPFVAINTAAIPAELMESEIFGHQKGAFTGAQEVRAGCFELSHTGTLFLDEIGEMPMALQPKLLRVLEDFRVRRLGGSKEFEFDVRILTATNRDPRESIEAGRLREDLYYRINVFHIHLPPLRERPEDIRLLTEHFVSEVAAKHNKPIVGVREEAVEVLQRYPWPGNVRELRNVLERAAVLAPDEWIEVDQLPRDLQDPFSPNRNGLSFPTGLTAAEVEKELILRTLERVNYNKAEAARQLGLNVKTIRNKLKTYESAPKQG